LDDAPRALLLFASLSRFLPPSSVHHLYIITPDTHAFALSPFCHMSPYPCTVLPESTLLLPAPNATHSHWEGYAVQMALKLLASRHVATEYYITLDADVLACGPIGHADLVNEKGKARFVDER
jgi:hypothetical protein